MADIYRSINNYLNKYQDPRTADWFLMSSPFPTLGICLAYVFTVKVLGPKLMENRKPFDLKFILIYYNFAQVVFSTWLFYQIGMSGWFTGEYSFKCQPVDYSNKTSTINMVHASWWYFFSKFTEFFDTIFFVLRKKNNHVSTLHVIHHGIMPMSVWFGVKYTPALREDKEKAQEGFYTKWCMIGIIGAVNGTHIEIIAPPFQKMKNINLIFVSTVRVDTQSINMMLVCDSDCFILALNARCPGSAHDAAIWQMSDLRRLFSL